MRAPETEATATTGHNEVSAAFTDIGWGPTSNNVHDLGTDLWVQVRDARRFDLSLVVGVQVKSGPSWFEEPLEEEGELIGWWFRGDQDHFDHWLRYSIPHLLVLHNLETKKSHWAHVTPEAVKSTGKQSKILVPAANVVEKAQRESLIDVASTGLAGIPWEGSAWMAGSAVPQTAQLRHALVAPRLMAPHPNAGFPEPPSPEQIIAMLMQARLRDIERCAADFAEIPSPGDASGSSDWIWQFFGGLWKRVTDTEVEPLVELIATAPSPASRAASVVAAASVLIETGRSSEAIDLLDESIDLDDCDPVDHSWLLVQRARANAEIGEVERAQRDAIDAQAARPLAARDATAGAISASASVLLFNTAAWGEHNIEEVVVRSDTVAGWWQSQVTSRALGAALERSFKSWAEDSSVTFAAEDVVHNQLEAASLASSHEGDQAGWRIQAARQAMASLIGAARNVDPARAAQALTQLRMSGDDKSLVLAIRHLSGGGPALAVTIAGGEIDLSASTRSTSYADLKFLEWGGDLLRPEDAATAAKSLLEILDDPEAFGERTRPGYIVPLAVLESLKGVIGASGPEVQSDVAKRVLDLEPQDHQLFARAWSKLASALPVETFSVTQAQTLAERADSHGFPLETTLLRIAGELGNTEAKHALLAKAIAGSSDAMAALGPIAELDPDLVKSEVARLAKILERQVTDAHSGKFGVGSYDHCRNLTLLNLFHPNHAKWQPVLDLLGDAAIPVGDKTGSLLLLAGETEDIPDHVVSPLSKIALRLARKEDPVMTALFDHGTDASSEASLLALSLGAIDEQEAAEQFARLMSGDAADRARAADIAGTGGSAFHRGVLCGLIGDGEVDVRVTACAWLMTCCAAEFDADLESALIQASKDPGRSVAMQIALALPTLEKSDDGRAQALAPTLRNALIEHPSARVRAKALTVTE